MLTAVMTRFIGRCRVSSPTFVLLSVNTVTVLATSLVVCRPLFVDKGVRVAG